MNKEYLKNKNKTSSFNYNPSQNAKVFIINPKYEKYLKTSPSFSKSLSVAKQINKNVTKPVSEQVNEQVKITTPLTDSYSSRGFKMSNDFFCYLNINDKKHEKSVEKLLKQPKNYQLELDNQQKLELVKKRQLELVKQQQLDLENQQYLDLEKQQQLDLKINLDNEEYQKLGLKNNKRILIIAKLKLFKKAPSDNRMELLNYLNEKPNITVIDDDKSDKISNYNPDIIIYYFLSRSPEWITINIQDFNMYYKKIPRFMIFEDHHYYDIVIKLYKKYTFDYLFILCHNIKSEKEYKKHNIKYKIWGFYIDTTKFKDYIQQKEYDLLLYGSLSNAYPLRKKMYNVLKYLEKNKKLKIKIIEHPGYNNYEKAKKLPKGEELSKIINKSRFTLVSSSVFNLLVKKYYEVPMSGSTIIGNIPSCYQSVLKNNVISIPFNSTKNTILKTILDAINNKYINIEKNSRIFGIHLSKTKNFDNAYKKLNMLCNT